MHFPDLNDSIIVCLQKLTEFGSGHRFLTSYSFLEAFPYRLPVVLVESAEVRREPILDVLGIAFNKPVHGLTLRARLFGIEHMPDF